jgi:hypothetical protein
LAEAIVVRDGDRDPNIALGTYPSEDCAQDKDNEEANVNASSHLDAVLRIAAERGDVPGVVAMAATRDGVIYEGAFAGVPCRMVGRWVWFCFLDRLDD